MAKLPTPKTPHHNTVFTVVMTVGTIAGIVGMMFAMGFCHS